MKHFFYLLAVTLLVTSCTQPFKKAKDGTQYKIIKSKNGKKLVTGNYMELYAVAKYKDSILSSSFEDGIPQYAPYDTAQFPPLFKEIFKDVNVGDSVVLKISTDSIINKGQGAPFMKKGQFIIQAFKITNAFATKEQSDSAYQSYIPLAKVKAYKKANAQIKKDLVTTLAPQMKIDAQILTDFMAKKGTKAAKTDWGTYVVITNPGAGENLSEKNIALVNYTGKTLADSVFDSNVDPKFGHVDPLSVDMSQFGVIPGWIDGLKMLKKGSKATLFIPSSLAYGVNGREPGIKPNENLQFDIEVLDILTPEQNEAMLMAKQQEQMANQQKMQEEAMKKAPKGSTDKK
ncbi:MAG: FKBP-type peptidyl-prolyl cis-trans isomerase [Ferruginibacter sp.]|nr:FKBP-type peptidyl-prolyl cis-trans isomerase [Ferruginibacter sp.]